MKTIATLTINPAIDKSSSIDRVLPNKKLYCGTPEYEPGGGGINVSRVIKRLGGQSTAIYPAGGTTGQLLQDLVRSEGLTQFVITISGLTRENLTVYEESTGQQFRFGMPGPWLSQLEWRRCLDTLAEIEPAPDFVVASGSLPYGVPEDFYAQIIRIAEKKGAKIIVDTSGSALRRALEEGVYLIKPNMNEFRQIIDREIIDEQELEEEAKKIVEQGQSEVVAISLGAGGMLGVWKGGSQRIQSPTVPIKSRVGAGDSAVAGIVLALSRNESVRNALSFGVAAGAAAVMTPGTELCRREDTERLYRQIIALKEG